MTIFEPDSADMKGRMRSHLGQALTSLAGLPGIRTAYEPGWWLAFMGRPAADLNTALVYHNDRDCLATVVAHVADAEVGALIMLAGNGTALAGHFPAGWESVGSMPMMARDLTASSDEDDTRVRHAGPADSLTVAALAAEAFDLNLDDVRAMTDPAASGEFPIKAWLLEDAGIAVATVMTVTVEDSVSIWTMATPKPYARRGYGAALLGAVLTRARADGARIGLLGATPAGLPLYLNRGWRLVENWQIHTNALSAQFH